MPIRSFTQGFAAGNNLLVCSYKDVFTHSNYHLSTQPSVLPSESPRSPYHSCTHNLDRSSSHLHSILYAVCVCELVHLTLMAVFMNHPFLSPLSLTPARPSPSPVPSSSQLTPLLPTILQHNNGFPLLSTHPLGATHSFRLCGQVHSCSSSHLFPPYSVHQ